MPGADSFVSRPAGFCVQTDGDCSAGDASCPIFKRAGEAFDLRIRAMAWESAGDTDLCTGNGDTPNFKLNNLALSHILESPSPTATPVPGQPGTLGASSYNHLTEPNARQTVSQSVSEVGVFRFLVTPAANSYFGDTVTGGQSAPVGRFIPDHFDLKWSIQAPLSLSAALQPHSPILGRRWVGCPVLNLQFDSRPVRSPTRLPKPPAPREITRLHRISASRPVI